MNWRDSSSNWKYFLILAFISWHLRKYSSHILQYKVLEKENALPPVSLATSFLKKRETLEFLCQNYWMKPILPSAFCQKPLRDSIYKQSLVSALIFSAHFYLIPLIRKQAEKYRKEKSWALQNAEVFAHTGCHLVKLQSYLVKICQQSKLQSQREKFPVTIVLSILTNLKIASFITTTYETAEVSNTKQIRSVSKIFQLFKM